MSIMLVICRQMDRQKRCAYSRSSLVNHLGSSLGVEGTMKNATKPTKVLNTPS